MWSVIFRCSWRWSVFILSFFRFRLALFRVLCNILWVILTLHPTLGIFFGISKLLLQRWLILQRCLLLSFRDLLFDWFISKHLERFQILLRIVSFHLKVDTFQFQVFGSFHSHLLFPWSNEGTINLGLSNTFCTFLSIKKFLVTSCSQLFVFLSTI